MAEGAGGRTRGGRLERIIGGSPLGVLARLALLSFVVGAIMAAVDLQPLELVAWLERQVRRIADIGWGTVEAAARYFVTGAVIVVPVWILWRIVKATRG